MKYIVHKHLNPFALLILLNIYANTTIAKNVLKVAELRAEYTINPLGIDAKAPRLSWKIIADARNVFQTAYEINAAKSAEDLKAGKALIWKTAKVNSDRSINIKYSGEPLYSGERIYWQVRVYDNMNHVSEWSEPAYWEMGLLNPEDWKAQWVAPDIKEDTAKSQPCPMLRKEFDIKKQVKQARLYITSHGLYLMELNGTKVSDYIFTPSWTSYNKHLQYQVYDVSSQLRNGRNAVGIILGDGWYRGFLAWHNNRNSYGTKLALLMQLEITYIDNTKETIISDNTWKSATGPILSSDIYNGETYDARLEKGNWTNAGYNDKDWKGVIPQQLSTTANKRSSYSIQNLVAAIGPPVRRIQEIKPVKIFRTPDGKTVADMGQNMVGWLRLEASGKPGTEITLKFAEVLDRKGNFYTENLRVAQVTDKFILKGEGREVFEPHFTFHGFRYVAIEGYPGDLKPENLTGIVIHSDMTPVGSFECSDSLVNKLQHNILWGLKGNFLDVPTDCPQRDERLGWTGDAEVFAPTACFNMDAFTFYSKWLKDMSADQMKDGAIPWVIPDILNKGAAAGWADACAVIPWTLYKVYGDTLILQEQYDTMKKWVDYMKNVAGDSYLWTKGDQFGDWLAFSTTDADYPGATTDKDLVATAYYAYSSELLIKAAKVLGKKEDVEKYGKLLAQIKSAYQNEFITNTGRLASNTQTAYTLSLAFDLVPQAFQQKDAERLANDVAQFRHLTTGFLGTPLICSVLSKYGYNDLAFMLLLNKKYPSWLYPVTMGATTIWERWDGIKTDSTFQDKDMNSFNHYAYGAIGNWLYSYVAGIQPEEESPGYKHFILNPHYGGELTFAKSEFQSVYGMIESQWQIKDNEFIFNVTVPPNTSADVYIPDCNKQLITENDKPISKVKDIKYIETKNDQSVFKIGSGKYVFKTKIKTE